MRRLFNLYATVFDRSVSHNQARIVLAAGESVANELEIIEKKLKDQYNKSIEFFKRQILDAEKLQRRKEEADKKYCDLKKECSVCRGTEKSLNDAVREKERCDQQLALLNEQIEGELTSREELAKKKKLIQTLQERNQELQKLASSLEKEIDNNKKRQGILESQITNQNKIIEEAQTKHEETLRNARKQATTTLTNLEKQWKQSLDEANKTVQEQQLYIDKEMDRMQEELRRMVLRKSQETKRDQNIKVRQELQKRLDVQKQRNEQIQEKLNLKEKEFDALKEENDELKSIMHEWMQKLQNDAQSA